jgi:hypothetical protein
MKDKTYNRIVSAFCLITGAGGVLVSLVHAIPNYGALGFVPLILSLGAMIIGLDKDTD